MIQPQGETNMQNDMIQEIEMTIAEARDTVARARRVRDLIANPIFKEIVDDGYLVQEAARLAHLSADPGMPPHARDAVLRDLNGPGAFKRYIQTILQQGAMAEHELEQAQIALSEELAADPEVTDEVVIGGVI
jgi:hypothetical protein